MNERFRRAMERAIARGEEHRPRRSASRQSAALNANSPGYARSLASDKIGNIIFVRTRAP
jgi:hypothetical protein